MRKILLFLAFTLLLGSARATPATAESVEKLLEVTKTESLFGSVYASMEQVMRQTAQQSLAGKPLTPEQQQALETMTVRFMAIVREDFTWDKMKPQYVQLYLDTFTEEEILGLVAFYRSSAGQAYVNKMPVVLQKSMAITQAQMRSFIPKMTAVIEQTLKDGNAPH